MAAFAAALAAVEAFAEPPCTAVARVSGDAVLGPRVVALLSERGVPVSGAGECGTVTAVVVAEGERVRVTISDGEERVIERVAADVEGAATWIESWARRDVSAPLLAVRALPALVQEADREAPPPVQAIRRAPAPSGRAWAVAADVEMALSSDESLWTGVRGHGCLGVGRLCLGALVGYAEDSGRRGDSEALQTARWALDLLVTADVPLGLGRFAVIPGAGAGLSMLKAEREVFRGESEEMTAGLLLRAHVAADYRISGAWAVRLDLAWLSLPFARSRLGEADDPLAGVPASQATVGLGLTYRGP